MTRVGLSTAVIGILGPATVYSILAINVMWGASMTKIITTIVVVRVVVVVTTTIRAHGLSGLVKFWKGLCNWHCSQRCYSQSCGWNGGMSSGYKGNSL